MKVVKTRKRCPDKKCKGEMITTNNVFSNAVGSSYQHRCHVCDYLDYFSRAYPGEHFEYTKKEFKEVWE